jgi:hypothetical protein
LTRRHIGKLTVDRNTISTLTLPLKGYIEIQFFVICTLQSATAIMNDGLEKQWPTLKSQSMA